MVTKNSIKGLTSAIKRATGLSNVESGGIAFYLFTTFYNKGMEYKYDLDSVNFEVSFCKKYKLKPVGKWSKHDKKLNKVVDRYKQMAQVQLWAFGMEITDVLEELGLIYPLRTKGNDNLNGIVWKCGHKLQSFFEHYNDRIKPIAPVIQGLEEDIQDNTRRIEELEKIVKDKS